MISQFLYLNFDGKSCRRLNIACVNGTGNNSLYQDTFVASKTINEDTETDRDRPYFKSVSKSPITIQLILGKVDPSAPSLTMESLQQIKQWINKDTYSEFYFEEYPMRHYFGMMSGDSTLNHNGLGEGYIPIQIRCDSPYAYSPAMSDYIHVPSDGIEYMLENRGDEIMYPSVELTKIGNGYISILNQTNRGNQTVITNLKDGETVYLDSEHEILESSLENVYHADDFNDVLFECPVGRNQLKIFGECKMKLNWRYVFD